MPPESMHEKKPGSIVEGVEYQVKVSFAKKTPKELSYSALLQSTVHIHVCFQVWFHARVKDKLKESIG